MPHFSINDLPRHVRDQVRHNLEVAEADSEITTRARDHGYARAAEPETKMNRTEAAYARHLGLLKRAGKIVDYRFEAINLRIGAHLFYRPDFLVIGSDRVVEFHEVKGHWREDARVKIKTVATLYPCFRFLAAKKAKGGRWDVEHFEPFV